MSQQDYEPSDRYWLVVVLEGCEATRGQALESLRGERVAAVPLPSVTDLRVAYDHLRPRVVLLDVDTPREEEIALVRTLKANDLTGAMSVVVVGNVPEQELPVELCELTSVYLRKPVEWKKVARTVVDLANARRSPSSGMRLNTP